MKPLALLSATAVLALGFTLGRYLLPPLLGTGSGNVTLETIDPNLPASRPPRDAGEIVGVTPLDPQALLSVLKQPDSYDRWKGLTLMATQLRREDFAEAIRLIEKQGGTAEEGSRKILIGRWIQVDPESALRMAHQPGNLTVSSTIFETFYGSWAARDPAKALAQAQALPESMERHDALEGIADEVAANDPALAASIYRGIHSTYYIDANHRVYSRWADLDLAGATEALLQPQNFAREARREEAVNGVVDHLMEGDPHAVVAWMEGLPEGPVRQEAFRRLADRWGQIDPPSTLAWLEKTPDSMERLSVIANLTRQWADQDPRGAIAYATTLPDESAQKGLLLTQSLNVWASADASSAWDWAQAQPDSVRREGNLRQIISTWAEADPAAAASHLSALSRKQPNGTTRLSEVIFDPDQGGIGFPNPYAQVASKWAQVDQAPAAAWIGRLPAGKDRDRAAEAFSNATLATNPQQALQMATIIGDPAARQDITARLFRQWMKLNRSAALPSLMASSLPESVKQQILSPFR